jgi:hypothetical protein
MKSMILALSRLHLIDVNLAIGNLVDIVREQARRGSPRARNAARGRAGSARQGT